MGIDIYAVWDEQDDAARLAQRESWFSTQAGHFGYIREAYHGAPYPSRYLVPEAFEQDDGAVVPAAVLRERLPDTVLLAEERQRKVYRVTAKADIHQATQQYRDFVKFCETVEAKTGKPVTILASW